MRENFVQQSLRVLSTVSYSAPGYRVVVHVAGVCRYTDTGLKENSEAPAGAAFREKSVATERTHTVD